MNTLTKIKIDRVIGKPIVILLNLAARFLGFILRIDHSFKKNPRSIAVCKFMGMGNIIEATPLLQTLRKNFPNAKITFITRISNHEIIELIPFIDKAFYINDRSFGPLFLSSIKMILILWRKKNDIYIDLETYSHFSTFIATMSLSKNRLSFYRREDHIRLGIYTHMMFFNNNAPISKTYLQMARFVGCEEIISDLYHFDINENKKDKFLKRFESEFNLSKDRPLVLINPNSSDLLKERRWPAENFVLLIEELNSLPGNIKFGFIGSANEKYYTKNIIDKIHDKSNIIDFSGKLSISELIVLTEISKIIITNDSGPMHIALSLNKPTLALFGPYFYTSTDYNSNFIRFYKNIYCSPCVHEFIKPPCKGNNVCMKKISVDEVKIAFLSLMNNETITNETIDRAMTFSFEENPLGIILR
jgi:ADP-heptose:LPS heptosyltransferase